MTLGNEARKALREALSKQESETRRKAVELLRKNRQKILKCASEGMSFITIASYEIPFPKDKTQIEFCEDEIKITITPLMDGYPSVGAAICFSWSGR